MSVERIDLSASAAVIEPPAYRGGEVDDLDIDSDEEPEVLVVDDGDDPLVDGIDDGDDDDSDGEYADAKSGDDSDDPTLGFDLSDLSLGPPKLENASCSIVVEFWEDGDIPVFSLNTSEQFIPVNIMHSLCNVPRLTPLRMENIVDAPTIDPDQSKVEEIYDDSDGESENDDNAQSRWVPTHGYVNVVMCIYTKSSTIFVGLLSERYDVDNPHMSDLDARLPGERKRSVFGKKSMQMHWIDSAVTGKRSRDSNSSDVSSAAAATSDAEDSGVQSVDSIPHSNDGMTGFAAEGNTEWTNHTTRSDVICSFERIPTSGDLVKTRVAVSLHSPRLRNELQSIMDMTNRM